MSEEAAEPKTPVWKNPFVIGFVVGIAALTVLPFLQRRFLKAPPPIRPLGSWTLQDPKGNEVSADMLHGLVLVAQALPADCMPLCRERVEAQASLLKHFEDLGPKVKLVTFVVPTETAEPFARTFITHSSERWLWLTGSPDDVDKVVQRGFLTGLNSWSSTADAGTTSRDFSQLPSFALVDQNGAIRGFWMQDELGRGNLINAARLLANYGPEP